MPGEPLSRESHYDRAGRLFILAALGLAVLLPAQRRADRALAAELDALDGR
jgi:hypothetical protein